MNDSETVGFVLGTLTLAAILVAVFLIVGVISEDYCKEQSSIIEEAGYRIMHHSSISDSHACKYITDNGFVILYDNIIFVESGK